MIDYSKEPWEVMDAPARMFGIFDQNGYSSYPEAVFADYGEAAAYIENTSDGGPERCICPVDQVTGSVFNSTEDAPEVESNIAGKAAYDRQCEIDRLREDNARLELACGRALVEAERLRVRLDEMTRACEEARR